MLKGVEDLYHKYNISVHAGGMIYGCVQTNTKEAFEYWYKRGVRIFEFDVTKPEDGDAVLLAHHLSFGDLLKCELTSIPPTITAPWYLSQKLFPISTNGLTPLSLNDFICYIETHADCLFQMDLWGNGESELNSICNQLSNHFGLKKATWNRILFEIYDLKSIAVIKRIIPMANIMWGFVDGLSEGVTPAILIGNGIQYVSCPGIWIKKHDREYKDIINSELTVFSLTPTNLWNSRKRRNGVHVNIVDYKFESKTIIFELPRYMYYRCKNAIVFFYVRCRYYGLKKCINKIIARK